MINHGILGGFSMLSAHFRSHQQAFGVESDPPKYMGSHPSTLRFGWMIISLANLILAMYSSFGSAGLVSLCFLIGISLIFFEFGCPFFAGEIRHAGCASQKWR